MARDAYWRCSAIESATSLRAATLSSSVTKILVVSSGTPSRGFCGRAATSSSIDVMFARKEGVSGGNVCEEEGSRRGVEVVELSVDGGRTRFARKKEKNAVGC